MGFVASNVLSSASVADLSSTGYDPRALDRTRLASKGGDAASTRKVAQQFESMFLSMMLKNMRATLPNTDPLSNSATKMATDMFDQQLSQNIATKGRGMGLADALVAQIERSQGKPATGSADALSPSMPLSMKRVTRSEGEAIAPNRTAPVQGATEAAKASASSASAAPSGNGIHRDFFDRFKDAAIAAAEATGLPAKVIMGQAALESGWGKHEVRDAKGTGSHNLFGIKAGPSWKGATVDAVTTEVIDGVAQKVVQKFRAYASYAESFVDYAKLVANNPRYEKAMQVADDAVKFATEMGRSGYATDPNYGSKLARVFAGPLGKLL